MKRVIAIGAAAAVLLAWAACDLTNVEVGENLPPYIASVTPERPIAQIGDRTVFVLDASDPDSDAVDIVWDRDGKPSSTLETAGRLARFVGNEDRDYTILVILDDGESREHLYTNFPVVTEYEDLEVYDPGVVPNAPWTIGTGNYAVRVTDKTSADYGGRSLEFVDYGTPSEPAALLDVSGRVAPGSGNGADEIVGFHVLLDGQGFVARCYEMPDMTIDGLVWEIVFDEGQIVALGPDGFKDKLANAVQRQWLAFEILMDFGSNRWIVHINGQKASDEIAMFTQSAVCDGIQFAGTDPNDASNFYIDDVVVTSNPDFAY